ncbi:DNase I-like protein, partial [Suillus brevipes Sb2]
MRGRWSNGSDKWLHINQIVKEKRIAILATQETHLSKEDETSLNTIFSSRLKIISSIDPNHTNAQGVALVLNKDLTITREITSHEIIPGRALLVSIPWHREEKITILTIYAPNEPNKNKTFWDEVLAKLSTLPPPDIMLGDFNMVEDALDRLPPKSDSAGANEALARIKAEYQLRDGWRIENPDLCAYTFMQPAALGGRQSRIDRIYVNQDILPFSKEWDINAPGIHTDHQMISARISDRRMPFIGKGRWVIPLFILKDKNLEQELLKMGTNLHKEIEATKSLRSDQRNAQTALKNFKDQATLACRSAAKKAIPKTQNRINKLKAQLKDSMNDKSLDESERRL